MSNHKTIAYIIKTTDCDDARCSFVGLFDAVFLSSICFSSSPFRVRRWTCVRPVEGDMLLEGQWGKDAADRPVLDATAPSIGENRKGVVCIRLFKVVPTATASSPSQEGGNQSPARLRHNLAEQSRITSSLSFCAAGPDDAAANLKSHTLAPLWYHPVFLGRSKTPWWEGSGDYWFKNEFRPREGASVSGETGWCSTMSQFTHRHALCWNTDYTFLRQANKFGHTTL